MQDNFPNLNNQINNSLISSKASVNNFQNNNSVSNNSAPTVVFNSNPLGSLGSGPATPYIPNSNNKKKIIIFGVIIILILGSVLGYLFLKNKNTTISSIADSLNFPSFGDANTNTFDANGQFDAEFNAEEIEGDYQDLLKIWDKPVLAFTYKKEKIVQVLQSDIVDATASGTEAALNQKTTEREADMIYFVDKSTGNIYKREIDGTQNTQPTKVSKSNIIGINYATFDGQGNHLAIVKNGQLFIDSVSAVPEGSFDTEDVVDENVSRVYSNNFDNNFIYTKKENNNNTSLFRYSNGNVAKLGTLPWTGFNIIWGSKDSIFIVMNPADNDSQKILKFNLNNAKISNFFTGMSDTIFRGDNIITSTNGTLRYKNTSGLDVDINVNTFANKCSFANDKVVICGVPDSMIDSSVENWYKGAIVYKDYVNLVDLSSGVYKEVVNPMKSINENIDVYNSNIKDNVMLFQNKKDDSLWSLDLNYYLK